MVLNPGKDGFSQTIKFPNFGYVILFRIYAITSFSSGGIDPQAWYGRSQQSACGELVAKPATMAGFCIGNTFRAWISYHIKNFLPPKNFLERRLPIYLKINS